MNTSREMDISRHTVDNLRIAVSDYRDAEEREAAAKQSLAEKGQVMDEAANAIARPDATKPTCPPDEVYMELLSEGDTQGARAYAEYWLIRQLGINEMRIWQDRYNTCSVLLKDC